MKFIAFALTTAGLVAAQDASNLPSCAQSCLSGFTSGSEIAGCARLDVACICSNDDFLSGIACCLSSDCSADDQAAAVAYAADICNAQGVTVPSAVTCATAASTAAPSTTSASSDSTATAASSTTDATTTSSGSSETSSTQSTNAGPTAALGVGSLAGGLIAAIALL